MKFHKTGFWLIGFTAIAMFLAVGGCCSILGPAAPKTTVDVTLNAAVKVLDLVNNTPVNGVPVYFVACAPNQSGFRDVHMTNTTGDDGWAVFSTRYTLDKNESIYLGASDRKELVDSDFGTKNFNGSGYLGEWKAFNYTLLYNSEDNKATLSCLITVELDSGKMI